MACAPLQHAIQKNLDDITDLRQKLSTSGYANQLAYNPDVHDLLGVSSSPKTATEHAPLGRQDKPFASWVFDRLSHEHEAADPSAAQSIQATSISKQPQEGHVMETSTRSPSPAASHCLDSEDELTLGQKLKRLGRPRSKTSKPGRTAAAAAAGPPPASSCPTSPKPVLTKLQVSRKRTLGGMGSPLSVEARPQKQHRQQQAQEQLIPEQQAAQHDNLQAKQQHHREQQEQQQLQEREQQQKQELLQQVVHSLFARAPAAAVGAAEQLAKASASEPHTEPAEDCAAVDPTGGQQKQQQQQQQQQPADQQAAEVSQQDQQEDLPLNQRMRLMRRKRSPASAEPAAGTVHVPEQAGAADTAAAETPPEAAGSLLTALDDDAAVHADARQQQQQQGEVLTASRLGSVPSSRCTSPTALDAAKRAEAQRVLELLFQQRSKEPSSNEPSSNEQQATAAAKLDGQQQQQLQQQQQQQHAQYVQQEQQEQQGQPPQQAAGQHVGTGTPGGASPLLGHQRHGSEERWLQSLHHKLHKAVQQAQQAGAGSTHAGTHPSAASMPNLHKQQPSQQEQLQQPQQVQQEQELHQRGLQPQPGPPAPSAPAADATDAGAQQEAAATQAMQRDLLLGDLELPQPGPAEHQDSRPASRWAQRLACGWCQQHTVLASCMPWQRLVFCHLVVIHG